MIINRVNMAPPVRTSHAKPVNRPNSAPAPAQQNNDVSFKGVFGLFRNLFSNEAEAERLEHVKREVEDKYEREMEHYRRTPGAGSPDGSLSNPLYQETPVDD